jgi:hypothetical protein
MTRIRAPDPDRLQPRKRHAGSIGDKRYATSSSRDERKRGDVIVYATSSSRDERKRGDVIVKIQRKREIFFSRVLH